MPGVVDTPPFRPTRCRRCDVGHLRFSGNEVIAENTVDERLSYLEASRRTG